MGGLTPRISCKARSMKMRPHWTATCKTSALCQLHPLVRAPPTTPFHPSGDGQHRPHRRHDAQDNNAHEYADKNPVFEPGRGPGRDYRAVIELVKDAVARTKLVATTYGAGLELAVTGYVKLSLNRTALAGDFTPTWILVSVRDPGVWLTFRRVVPDGLRRKELVPPLRAHLHAAVEDPCHADRVQLTHPASAEHRGSAAKRDSMMRRARSARSSRRPRFVSCI